MTRKTLLCMVVFAATASMLGCKKKDSPVESPAVPPQMAVELPGSLALPEDVMAVVACQSPATLIADIEKVLSATGLIMPGMLSMQLNRLLLEMGLSKVQAVDLSRPAAVIVLNPKEFSDPVVLRLSLSGKDDFLSALSPAWKKGEEKEGIVEMESAGVDTYAVFKGGADAQAVPHPKEKLFVRVAEGRAWLGASREAVLSSVKGDPAASLSSRSLMALVRIDRLRKLYGQEVRAAVQDTRQQMIQLLKDTGVGTPPVTFMYGWLIDKMAAAFEQIGDVQIALGVADGALMFKAGVGAEPGSFFARLLAAQKRDTPQRLYTLLSGEGFLTMGMNVQWDLLKPDLAEFSAQLLGTVFDQGAVSTWAAVVKDMLEALGDEVAATENIGPDGLSLDEIVALKDEAKARTAIGKTLKLLEQATPSLQVPGLRYRVSLPGKVGEHQGVELHGFDFVFEPDQMAPGEAEMLKRMYGDRLRLVFAVFDGKMTVSMGKDSVAQAKALIDRARKNDTGMPLPPHFQAAAGGLERRSGAFMFMSISGILNHTMSMMNNPMLAGAAPASPKMKSGLFFAFESTPERLSVTLRLPAEHLKETGDAMRSLTQMSSSPPPSP